MSVGWPIKEGISPGGQMIDPAVETSSPTEVGRETRTQDREWARPSLAIPSANSPGGTQPLSVRPRDVCLELDRICRHPLFANAPNLQEFLRYTVGAALEGRDDGLKEYVIATSVFRRRSDFDPRKTSIVRTQAGRLRAKLRQYYSGPGSRSSVYIVYSPGSYSPSFRAAYPSELLPETSGRPHAKDEDASLAILPMQIPQSEPGLRALGEFLENLLCSALLSKPGIRVVSGNVATIEAAHGRARGRAERGEPHYLVVGSIFEGECINLSLRLVRADDGLTLWAATVSASRHDCEQMAREIGARISGEIAGALESNCSRRGA